MLPSPSETRNLRPGYTARRCPAAATNSHPTAASVTQELHKAQRLAMPKHMQAVDTYGGLGRDRRIVQTSLPTSTLGQVAHRLLPELLQRNWPWKTSSNHRQGRRVWSSPGCILVQESLGDRCLYPTPCRIRKPCSFRAGRSAILGRVAESAVLCPFADCDCASAVPRGFIRSEGAEGESRSRRSRPHTID